MCDDIAACHTGIPDVKGWCLINHGLIPILSCSIQVVNRLDIEGLVQMYLARMYYDHAKHCISVDRYRLLHADCS